MLHDFKQMTTHDLSDSLKGGVKIIDVRPVDAYNAGNSSMKPVEGISKALKACRLNGLNT